MYRLSASGTWPRWTGPRGNAGRPNHTMSSVSYYYNSCHYHSYYHNSYHYNSYYYNSYYYNFGTCRRPWEDTPPEKSLWKRRSQSIESAGGETHDWMHIYMCVYTYVYIYIYIYIYQLILRVVRWEQFLPLDCMATSGLKGVFCSWTPVCSHDQGRLKAKCLQTEGHHIIEFRWYVLLPGEVLHTEITWRTFWEIHECGFFPCCVLRCKTHFSATPKPLLCRSESLLVLEWLSLVLSLFALLVCLSVLVLVLVLVSLLFAGRVSNE